jgi:putative peptidoglycan lipid II flippase
VSQRRRILTAASLLLIGNLASRLLGLAREQVITVFYGVTSINSAFQTAATVPQMFYDLVIGGAVSAALVPVLSDYADPESRGELGRVVSTLLVGAALLLGAVITALLALSVPLTELLGVAQTARDFSLTLGMVRLAIPALLFLGLAGVSSAVAYARHRYGLPALSISLFNGGLILTALVAHDRLGPTSLALGLLIGAALQCGAVGLALRGIPLGIVFEPAHPAVRRILRLYGPVAAGLVATEIAVLIDRHLAWQTGDTSVAIMRVATFLVQLPLGFIATGMSLAVLPLLSRLADDASHFRQVLGTGLRLAILGIAPAVVFLIVFREAAIALLFQHGRFDAEATRVTAQAFLLYAPQIPFVAIDQLLVYAFYARKNTLTPVLVGLAGVLIYLATALVALGPLRLGLWGLILANTLQNSLHAVILLGLLRRDIGPLGDLGLAGTAVRALIAGGAAGGVALALQHAAPAPIGLAREVIHLAAGGIGIGILYLGILAVLGVEEINTLRQTIQARLIARRMPSLDQIP